MAGCREGGYLWLSRHGWLQRVLSPTLPGQLQAQLDASHTTHGWEWIGLPACPAKDAGALLAEPTGR